MRRHTYNANTTQANPLLAEELLFVLDGWATPDDWNVPTYPYPDTCRHLLDCLKAGDNPRALRLLSNALGWKQDLLLTYCPRYAADEAARRAARR